jgi:sugar phosphate isomerase/epimerase
LLIWIHKEINPEIDREGVTMKLSFTTLGCPDWDLKTIAEKASEYGFDGVELRLKDKKHVDVDLDASERKEVRKLFESKNVEIACLSSYADFASDKRDVLEKNKDMLLSYIDLAVDLGSPCIRTFVGYYPETITEEQVTRNCAEFLNICGEKAEKKGIILALEIHEPFGTGHQIHNIIKLVNNNGVGVLWDIDPAIREGESPEETYRLVGSKVKHIHVKDSIMEADGKTTYKLMGEGDLPVGKIVDVLEANNYKGYYSLEWEKMWHPELEGPEIAFPRYVEYMRKLEK